MKYAVFQTGGKQYKAQEGSVLEVEKIVGEADSDLKFDQVLLYADNGNFQVGTPHVSGAQVTGKVLEQKKGEKIRVSKFKAKARYRRVTGHRQLLTKVQITKIALGTGKEVKVQKEPAGPASESKSKKTSKK
jgi:large subunit ribosomal protein L21